MQKLCEDEGLKSLPDFILISSFVVVGQFAFEGSWKLLLALNYRYIFKPIITDIFTTTSNCSHYCLLIGFSRTKTNDLSVVMLLLRIAHKIYLFFERPSISLALLTSKRDVSNWWTKVKLMHANIIRKLCDLYLFQLSVLLCFSQAYTPDYPLLTSVCYLRILYPCFSATDENKK